MIINPYVFAGGDITTGLLGLWKLDEGSGNPADTSGFGNNGTRIAATWATPGLISGYAAKINTDVSVAGSYVRWTQATGMDPTPNLTYTVKVKLNALPAGGTVGLVYGNYLSGTLCGIEIDSSGKLNMRMRTSGGGSTSGYTGTGAFTLSTGVIYRLTVTYNSSFGLVGYVGTAVDNTAAAAGNKISRSGIQLNLGCWNVGNSNRLSADYNDLRIYGRALSPADINLLP